MNKFTESGKCIESLDNDDHQLLLDMYQHLYPSAGLTPGDVSMTYVRRKSVLFRGELYGSVNDKHSNQAGYVMAHWCGPDGSILPDNSVRPGKVSFYMEHCIQLHNKIVHHQIAAVKWFEVLESAQIYPSPIVMVRKTKFVQPGPSVFMPIQRMKHKFATAKDQWNIVVLPMYGRI